MRNKKLLSTVVASALVATTMAMPVMAADGGEVDVDVSTRKAVIRVQVPTTLEIAVNQFEKGDAGSQIYSEPFGITNKSEIPVKVSITSTATLDNTKPIGLVATKAAAEKSTAEDGEAWLAVAAQTSNGKYTEESGKDVKDLTEAAANVTTFVQDETTKSEATAEQLYYLATETTPSVTYTKVAPTDADELAAAKNIAYAQFYELTELSAQPSTDATLQKEVDKADIYAIDGSDAVTFLEKGTKSVTYAAGSKYYSVAPAATLSKDLATSKIYVYAEAGDGGKAGFRYIGKLSEKETWTDADITNVKIKYDITGVTATKYAEVEDDCVYGLYPNAAAVTPGLTYVSGKDDSDVVLKFTAPAGKTLATNFAKVNGVDASSWGSFGTNFVFDTTANTLTIKAAVFGFGSVSGATTAHKYVFTVKDSDGTEYSTEEVDLTP